MRTRPTSSIINYVTENLLLIDYKLLVHEVVSHCYPNRDASEMGEFESSLAPKHLIDKMDRFD